MSLSMIAWPTIVEAGYAPHQTRRNATPKKKNTGRATRGAETFSPAMKLHEDIPDDEPSLNLWSQSFRAGALCYSSVPLRLRMCSWLEGPKLSK